MQIKPDIARIVKGAGLDPQDALWHHKQSNQWIMYHRACEKAAAAKGVRWESPQVIQADAANKLAVVLVTGRLGGAVEWSFGEAAPYNTTQAYPFAMAEKRAKDRVILKLLGLHGEVYSEVESDDFKQNGNGSKPSAISADKPKGKKTPEDFLCAVQVADGEKLATLDGWLREHGAEAFGNDKSLELAKAVTNRAAVLAQEP